MKESQYQLSIEDFFNQADDEKKELVIKASEADIDIMRPLIVARKQAHLTQKELADKVKMDQGDISKLERGLRNPTVHLLQRLAEAMDLEVEIKYVRKEK